MDTHLEKDSPSSRKIQQKKHVEKDFTKHKNNHSRLEIKNSQLEIEKKHWKCTLRVGARVEIQTTEDGGERKRKRRNQTNT